MAAGVLWIAGGLADGSVRTVLWLVALAIDYGGAAVHLLGAGPPRVPPSAWAIEVATSPSASSSS